MSKLVKDTTRRSMGSTSWDHGSSQSLGHQPGSMQQLDLDSYIFVANLKLGLHVDSLTSGTGAISVYVPYHWISFPLQGRHDWAPLGEGPFSEEGALSMGTLINGLL